MPFIYLNKMNKVDLQNSLKSLGVNDSKILDSTNKNMMEMLKKITGESKLRYQTDTKTLTNDKDAPVTISKDYKKLVKRPADTESVQAPPTMAAPKSEGGDGGDYEKLIDDLDKEINATKIQSLARGVQGRKIAAKVKMQKEKLKELEDKNIRQKAMGTWAEFSFKKQRSRRWKAEEDAREEEIKRKEEQEEMKEKLKPQEPAEEPQYKKIDKKNVKDMNVKQNKKIPLEKLNTHLESPAPTAVINQQEEKRKKRFLFGTTKITFRRPEDVAKKAKTMLF